MFRKISSLVIVLMCIAVFSAMAPMVWAQDEIHRISKEEARERLDDPEVIFLDVRRGTDWRASQFKIEGAVNENPGAVDQWAGDYDTSGTYILYCA